MKDIARFRGGVSREFLSKLNRERVSGNAYEISWDTNRLANRLLKKTVSELLFFGFSSRFLDAVIAPHIYNRISEMKPHGQLNLPLTKKNDLLKTFSYRSEYKVAN